MLLQALKDRRDASHVRQAHRWSAIARLRPLRALRHPPLVKHRRLRATLDPRPVRPRPRYLNLSQPPSKAQLPRVKCRHLLRPRHRPLQAINRRLRQAARLYPRQA